MSTTPGRVVTVGAELFAQALEAQAVPVTRVDWHPPMDNTADDLASVAADPLRRDANTRAVEAVLAVQATLVEVAPASQLLGLEPGELLHAGPPRTRDRATGSRRQFPRLIGRAIRDAEEGIGCFDSGGIDAVFSAEERRK